jgi:predicted NodU family carbamoyl transferase
MCIDIFYKQVNDNLLHQKLKEIFPNARIQLVSHHLSHAASAIFSCDFNEGSFLTLDGAGTKVYDPYKLKDILVETNTTGYFNKSQNIFRLYPGPSSVNDFGGYYRRYAYIVYSKKTHIKNKENNESLRDSVSGKIMGLSAYGSWEITTGKIIVFLLIMTYHLLCLRKCMVIRTSLMILITLKVLKI